MSAAADKNVPELKTLGRYNIERVLGKGAMGVVYEGVDPRLGRRVAIKTILKSHLDEDTGKDFAMRFVREAQAVARLNHPNIVQVYDFGEENNIAYLVMEFIKGKELKNFFDANERFDLKECVRIMGELCEALEFAHAAGIIHRDIKPANVMIDAQGRTKLTDFGVARVQDSDKTSVERTQAGTMVGTPAYMSPEQITGGTIDKRTDVFSAGIILYQFLTGEKPFTGSGAWTIAKKIIQEEPPAPSTLNNAVTPIFDAVVNKALSKDPATRFQSAKELGLALQRALEGKGAEDDSDRTVVGPMTGAPVARPSPGMAGAPAQGTGATKTTTGTQSNQEVELEFWRAIKDGNDPDDFELYIQQFPAGIYAALAKRKIAKLRGEPLDDTSLKAKEQEKKEQEEAARREAEAKNKLEADKARLEAEMARKEEEYKKREAEAEAKRQELEKQRLAAEEQAKKEAAAEREKVRLEAEKARKEAAEAAEKARQEAAAERERIKAETEKFKKEAAERAAKELAAERERAKAEADKARKEASEAAEKAKKEAAAAAEKAKKEAEAFAKKQTEERAKREAEFKKREAELKAQAAAGGKKSSPVVPAIIGVVVLAIAGTGYWFLRPDDKAQKAQLEAMQRQLEEAKKKQQELEVARKAEEKARQDLEKARLAEAEARKSGDLAKQKELAEAMKRAEAEARKSADATKAREDDAKKSAAAAAAAKAEQDKVASAKKSADKSAADRSEQERLAREKAATDKAIADAKAQAEKAIAEAKAAAEKAAAERIAAEKAAADAKAKAQVAAAPSSGDQLFTQAASLEQEGKGRDAVKMYTQAARSGSGKAAKRLGEIYDKGLIGISRDYAESLKWYNAARVLGEDVPMAKSR